MRCQSLRHYNTFCKPTSLFQLSRQCGRNIVFLSWNPTLSEEIDKTHHWFIHLFYFTIELLFTTKGKWNHLFLFNRKTSKFTFSTEDIELEQVSWYLGLLEIFDIIITVDNKARSGAVLCNDCKETTELTISYLSPELQVFSSPRIVLSTLATL